MPLLYDLAMHQPHTVDLLRELNDEQRAAVLGGDGPCLVLAGAGSGKTRTITYRVAHLLDQGVPSSSILLLTFTNKASREMLERVGRLVGPAADGIWGGTFHSTANRVLRIASANSDRAGFTILDQEDSQSLLKAVMKELKIDPRARRFPSANVVQNILSFARNTRTSVAAALEMKHPGFMPFENEIEEIGRIFQTRKRAANSLDFDDLLIEWLALIEDPEMGQAMSNRFKYVLVDEYQDVNALQAAIVRGIARVHRNAFVVGDDAQSIYAFRGADVKNILRFPEEWPGAKIFKLVTNYRSVPEILEVANASLANNTAQFEKDLIGMRASGEKPRLVPCQSARREAEFITEEILKLRSNGATLASMAVLFRSSAHSQAMEFECVKRDIPYEMRGGMKFFSRAHIKDVLAHVRLVANAQDEAAWLRVLNLQQGIGSVTATSLARVLGERPLLEETISSPDVSSMLPGRAQEGWRGLSGTLATLIERRNAPAEIIRGVMESSYRDLLEREYPDFQDRLEDLEQLALFAGSYTDLPAFLSDISLYDEAWMAREGRGKADDGEERLVLSTIHQAKGLEWDSVFVIHLADNNFPSRHAMEDEIGLEEERRLFYVAVTRAKSKLTLTYPITMGEDAFMFNRESMFLQEIPPRLLSRVEIRDANAPRSHGFIRADVSVDDSPWGDDGEGVITIRRNGERTKSSFTAPTSKTVWKSTGPNPELPKRSFLRDV